MADRPCDAVASGSAKARPILPRIGDVPGPAPTAVLLIEDDPADAALIQSALADSGRRAFRVDWVTRLGLALELLARKPFEVVLLDLTLPDGPGLDALSALMHDAGSSATLLHALTKMGIQLAIDDFGTGYSSLSYLKRFPIGTLKIDRSFVRDIVSDADDATIVSAVIGMGKNLKQRVIAEGVETQAQLDFLRDQQCEFGQGYPFDHPMNAERFSRLLASGNHERCTTPS